MDNHSAPRISVITALYNHERYIAQAIESVLGQTFAQWEYIIWDDGSSDRSLSIAQTYAIAHPDRIKVFTHENNANRGQENTRNTAINHAKGEFLCILDSDDYFHPRKFELLLPKFTNPRVGLAHGKCDVRLENTGEVFAAEIPKFPTGKVFAELVQENFISAAAILMRKKCLEGGGGFDSAYRTIGEYPLWLKIAKNWEIDFVPEAVATWRDHGKNQGTKLALTSRAELVALCEKLLGDPNYQNFVLPIKKALARKRYDYASMLYAAAFATTPRPLDTEVAMDSDENIRHIRQLCIAASGEAHATKAIRAKALLLYAMTFLGKAANENLSKLKLKIWEMRHPVAAAARKSRT